jgi:hypothetical protein
MNRRTLFQSLCALLCPWSEAAPVLARAAPNWQYLDDLFSENAFHDRATLPEDGDPACARSVDEALAGLVENSICCRMEFPWRAT